MAKFSCWVFLISAIWQLHTNGVFSGIIRAPIATAANLKQLGIINVFDVSGRSRWIMIWNLITRF
jgi:hypothetical protein